MPAPIIQLADTATIAVHAIAGLVAVLVGFATLPTRKGGAVHRRLGRLFARAMAVVAVSGGLLLGLGHANLWLVTLLGLTSSVTWSAVRVLRRRRPDIDPAQRARAADWVMAGLALATGVLVLFVTVRTPQLDRRTAILSTAPLLVLYSAWDLWRFARPAAWPMHPRLWLTEHVVKIVGSWAGAVSAASGNLLLPVPMPWRIVVPNLLGAALTLVFLARLGRAVPAGSTVERPERHLVRDPA